MYKKEAKNLRLFFIFSYLMFWSDWFDGMQVMSQAGPDDIAVTSLHGKIVDQAALHCVLRKLYDLCIPLLSISYIGSEPVA